MKQAVVFIIDANPSMNLRYPRVKRESDEKTTGDDEIPATTTRLECAKLALESMVSDLMLQSKTNEVSVIVCKTSKTSHHKVAVGVDLEEAGDDLPFRNLTELSPGIVRPGVDLLRRISEIETASSDAAVTFQGDICDAFLLAADALYERGTKYKFQRKIVLITDAEHDVIVDFDLILPIIDELRDMSCRFEVIGLDFESFTEYDEPSQSRDDTIKNEESNRSKRIKRDEEETVKEESDREEKDDGDESDGRVVYTTKEDRERFLISLAEKTGGSVVAASTMQQVLNANRGKRVQSSVKTKFEFRIAPGLAFEARYCLLMSKQSFPTLKTEAVELDDDTGKPSLDELGQEITFKIQKTDLYVDPDEPDDIVDEENRAKAIQFGSTLVPMSAFDFEGLKPAELGARMEILGYVERETIPAAYLSGPPSVITGHDSKKACAGISALAQALNDLGKVAIATFYKRSTSKKPVLVSLHPLDEPEYPHPIHLVVLQIPFDGEIKQLGLDSLSAYLDEDEDEHDESAKARACDDLIECLRLPDDVLCSGQIPSPLLRSCNRTKMKRAIDSSAPVVKVRPSPDDNMVTPSEVLRGAETAIKAFEALFTGSEKKENPAFERRKIGRGVLTYKDYV